jgi:hypothetical protein
MTLRADEDLACSTLVLVKSHFSQHSISQDTKDHFYVGLISPAPPHSASD